jgi:membrane-bound lytic murein transglycosylase D
MKYPFSLASIFVIIIAVLAIGTLAYFTDSDQDNDKMYYESFARHNKIQALILPDTISFAGEQVPMDLFYVRESLDRELLVNTYWHSNTILMLKRASRYFPTIEKILKEHNIPDDFKYVALIESGFLNVVSPSNAAGFWQFLDNTAKQYGLEVTEEVDERYNVEKATAAAARYLLASYEKYKNWTLTAASYNAGAGRITREIEKQKVADFYNMYLNQETSRYIFRILAMKLIYEDPTVYGFFIRKRDLYPPIPTKAVQVTSDISDLITFAANNKVNYRILKEFNPWLRSNKLTVPVGKSYLIQLPEPGYTGYKKLQSELKDPDEIVGKGNLDTPVEVSSDQ